MSKLKRNIIHIDEEKCNGCGLCVQACAEGALAIVDGKARLISETYCDGLGACLGDCPQGAIAIEEREAEAFDESKVPGHAAAEEPAEKLPCGCPGTAVRTMKTDACCREETCNREDEAVQSSRLGNWPVQLRLIPENAPYLKGARLVLAADCTGFALPGFNERLLPGKVLLVGCPKLDDAAAYREKLARIFKNNGIRSLDIVYMEVPCCRGLVNTALAAIADAGTDIPVNMMKIGIQGEILS